MSEPAAKIAKMTSCLDQLKEHTVVVADTGDFEGGEKSRASLESVARGLDIIAQIHAVRKFISFSDRTK